MKKILINGDFLCRRLTGIERYAYEITRRLDEIISPGEAAIIIPNNAENVPVYKNLIVIRHKKNIKTKFWWIMVTLQFFLITNRRYIILEYGNVCLPFAPGVIFLHDIYCKIYKKDFTGFRDKLVCLYSNMQYILIAKKAKKIVTVSNFSRMQIAKNYNINPDKISVVYSSWNHFAEIKSDYSVFDGYPALKKPFYFSLGSLSKRKNMDWIIKYAAKHPDAYFAVSGAALPTTRDDSVGGELKNVLFLGYIDDSKVKALMEKCEAFILPSYYEGFGLPPLEALSCGARIIISSYASLPEIYGKTARYIDPFNTDVDIEALLNEPVDPPAFVLEKYSYDKSALQVYGIMKEAVRL
ncbi:MAG: glycosyltransferase family 4 protein [Spirochaetaceae bacterium]|jgi:glycosyltransferase involved in cell wall biosynthesis|nr:glycosyltransferase family 4 protein [Spirochaetaceae bacterium]